MNVTELLSGVKIGSLTLGDAIAAVVTALVLLVIIKAVMKLVGRLLSRTHLEGKVQGFIKTGIKAVLYILGGLIVMVMYSSCKQLATEVASFIVVTKK